MPMKFTDWEEKIKDKWFERSVEIMVQLGLIQGFEDGTFRPETPLTRAQYCAVMSRYLEAEGLESVLGALKSLVWVHTRVRRKSNGAVAWRRGSGFWMSDWKLVTNAHVVEDLDDDVETMEIQAWGNPSAYFSPVDPLPAEIITMAHEYDLAVLQATPPGYQIQEHLATLGRDPDQGQTVWAAGNPFGFPWDLCKGTVRHPARYINYWQRSQSALGLDVPINPGNSGGMLLDFLGRVVGVPSAGYVGANNLTFAVPVSHVKEVIGR